MCEGIYAISAMGDSTALVYVIARCCLKQNGITGWRRNYPVKGHPDFVFPKKKIAVFVDGCFWHGHDCRNTRPADHQEYWQKKRERNIKHDKEVTAMFESRGWIVLRIWECELKKKNQPTLLERLKLLIY